MIDRKKDKEETLLAKGREDKKLETPISLTWGVFTVELKRLSVLAGLIVAPQILIVLFLIYLFDNIIQLFSLRSLWYYGGW
jgi:hypothetical protein